VIVTIGIYTLLRSRRVQAMATQARRTDNGAGQRG